ncbi:unnamed protein product [Brassica napus]|uniref:(rape) hypothetical protein n=1 Tax=Brassica napus TaxID=3708 RepID=A0A816UZ51_BRANA|nr:unnamed protein product [Brassica napus]
MDMELEQKQAEIIDELVRRASTCKRRGPVAYHHRSYIASFSFRLFRDFGSTQRCPGNASRIPQLSPDQILKLKQLTVLTLAESNKVLPYDTLMAELDVTNVRELEDFLINDCMYAGIVRGKLDQLKKMLRGSIAAGRDLRPGQLGNMLHTLSNW